MRSILYAVMASCMLSACATEQPPPPVIEAPKVSVKPDLGQALIVTDPKTKTVNRTQSVEVAALRTARRDDRLVVNAVLKNSAGLREVVAVRVRWVDELGIQTVPYASSDSYSLEGGEEQALVFVAPNAATADIRIELESLR